MRMSQKEVVVWGGEAGIIPTGTLFLRANENGWEQDMDRIPILEAIFHYRGSILYGVVSLYPR